MQLGAVGECVPCHTIRGVAELGFEPRQSGSWP